jgi:hypothetical protein
MPCYYTGSEIGDARLARDEANAELTKLTRWLCAICHVADLNKWPLPNDLQRWWNKHKRIDAKRKATSHE